MSHKDRVAAEPGKTRVREFLVLNKLGIHARPAALFVKTAGRFAAEITVENEGATVSGKSIMGLLTLEGYQGARLKVRATGPDAESALEALGELFKSKFGED